MSNLIKTNDLSRRDFIRTVVLSAVSVVVLPGIVRADDNTPAKVTYVDIGDSSQFPNVWTKVVLPADYHQEVIYVRKVSDSPAVYQAVSARCTHKGCTVAFDSTQKEFICPCHHAIFDNETKNISGPGKHPELRLSPLHTLGTQLDDKKNLLVEAPPMPVSTGD